MVKHTPRVDNVEPTQRVRAKIKNTKLLNAAARLQDASRKQRPGCSNRLAIKIHRNDLGGAKAQGSQDMNTRPTPNIQETLALQRPSAEQLSVFDLSPDTLGRLDVV